MPKKKENSSSQPMAVLKQLREEAGLTQKELAKLIPDKSRKRSLTQQAVSKWENGQDEPELTILQVKALCKALGKSLEELPDDLGPLKTESENLTDTNDLVEKQ